MKLLFCYLCHGLCVICHVCVTFSSSQVAKKSVQSILLFFWFFFSLAFVHPVYLLHGLLLCTSLCCYRHRLSWPTALQSKWGHQNTSTKRFDPSGPILTSSPSVSVINLTGAAILIVYLKLKIADCDNSHHQSN